MAYRRSTARADLRPDQLPVGDAKTEDFNLFANAGAPIGDFELYGFASYGKRDGLSAANYRSANAAANRDFSTISPGDDAEQCQFRRADPRRLPAADRHQSEGLGGDGRGPRRPWRVEGRRLARLRPQRILLHRPRQLNTSFGTASQNVFDAGGLDFGQWLANVDFSRQFAVGLAAPLAVGIGVEYRHENFKITPGELQSYALGPLFRPAINNTTAAECAAQGGVFAGTTCSFPGRQAGAGAQGFPGIPPASATDESRHSYAGYVEFDAELFRNFTATVAGRYEKYSDFGNTVNGKIALRYEFVPGLAVRGSLSNGFRAPSLHQQYFTTTSTNFISGVPVDISTVAVSSPVARALGATELEPEKSRNLSIGATASPLRGLSLTADYYNIRIKDRIVLTENLGPGNTALPLAQRNAIGAVLAANGFQSVGAARFFINGLDTTTRGFDVIAAYRWRAGQLGTWNLTAAYNRNKTRIDNRINELGPLAAIPDLVLFGREQGVRFTRGQPENKVVLSADGEIRNFGLTARTTRYGEAVAVEATAPLAPNAALLDVLGPDDQVLSPKWITDLELRYKALGRDRPRDRREQPVRRLSRPPPVRRAATGRGLSAELPVHPLCRQRLAVRHQRALPLRARRDRLLIEAGEGVGAPLDHSRLVAVFALEAIAFAVERVEQRPDGGMVDRVALVVGDEVLLADVGDVARLGILGHQMVEGLVLRRAHMLGDRVIPFVAVREFGIDVEDHPAKIEQAMPHDVADSVAGGGKRSDQGNGSGHAL